MRQPHINTCSVPRLSQSLSSFARSGSAAALLNLLPCLIVCLWHLVIRPGFSVVIGDFPQHPALVGFHEPEWNDIGVYRWSTPDAALLVPGYALPGVVSFVGVPAPDGTRVRLPFPGSAFTVELPQNSGAPPLRRYALLWPERAEGQRAVVAPIEVQPPWGAAQAHLPATLFFGAVAIPLEAQTPPVRAETRALGLLVTRLDVAPVRAKGQAPLALVLGVAAAQIGYGGTAYRLFGWSGRRSLRLALGVGLALALAALWVQTQWVMDGIVFGLFVLALGSVATVSVIRLAFQRQQRLALLLGGAGLALGGMLGVWFGAAPFLGFTGSVGVGIIIYVFRILRRKIYAMALVALFCVVLYVNGISFGPVEEYRLFAENLFVAVGKMNYFQENILLPLIAYYTRSNDRFSYYFLCFLVYIVSCALFCLISIKKYGETVSVIVTALLITGQLNTIILSWLGKPDALSILLTLPLIFVKSPLIIMTLSTLGSANHIMYIISGTMILLMRRISDEKLNLLSFFSVLLGGFCGYLLVKMFLYYNGISIYTRMDFIVGWGLKFFLDVNLRHFFLNIFLLFSVQWMVVIVSFAMFFSRGKLFYSVFLLLILFCYILVLFTFDFTRVFQMLIWGSFVLFVVHSYFLAEEIGSRRIYTSFLAIIIGLSLVLPRFHSYLGSIFAAPFTLALP